MAPRLRSQWAIVSRAKELCYRHDATLEDTKKRENGEHSPVTDYIQADYYRTLRNVHRKYTHLLGIALDGFQTFKKYSPLLALLSVFLLLLPMKRPSHISSFSRQTYECWVVIAVDLNLPPEIRNRHENVLLLGLIPGPKAPVDLESFLLPIFDELFSLQGIKHYFASKNLLINVSPFAQ